MFQNEKTQNPIILENLIDRINRVIVQSATTKSMAQMPF